MDWYKKDVSQILNELNTSEKGLSISEAQGRLQKYGLNKLPEQKPEAALVIFLRQFQNPLIYVLLGISLAVFAIGEIIDGSIILFVLVFNAVMGSVQEGRANKTLLALKKFTETQATVLREGEELFISDSEIVPGDILVLREGERIPADARIIQTRLLKVDEAVLTGESIPVYKIHTPILGNQTLTEQKNMVFKGTHIVAGNCLAVVTATGLDTEIGKISEEIKKIDTEIPLKKEIRALSRTIIYSAGIISGGLFILGLLRDESPVTMFAAAVSLTVSIIPEGLPIVMTLVLATGVWRMSKRNALVKKLQAVEALGQATILAIDKTGTITRNEMIIRKVWTYDIEKAVTSQVLSGTLFDISGVGYTPKGDIKKDGQIISPANHPEILIAGRVAAYCANATAVLSKDGTWTAVGDPTEIALKVFAEKIGFNKAELEQESPMIYETPFDYRNKYHATLHKTKNGNFLSVVGAPEKVLDLCRNLSAAKKEELEKLNTKFSGEGLRVVAAAMNDNFHSQTLIDKVSNLTFVGLLGMEDSIRPEVKNSISKAEEAGLKIVMITGDHKLTAEAVAKEVGIFKNGDRTLTGPEIDSLNESELTGVLSRVSVFARVTPEHKLKIINAYRRRGEIVAMTGDGVNDAPSLVAADLGISMGKIGTEVAKEASDIVLLDDNLESVVLAIEEGRSIYKTVKKVILYLFSTSAGEALTIVGALVLNFPLPILPAQIIWLNLVTDGFLDVALAMEPKEDGLLKKQNKNSKRNLVDKLMVKRGIFMSVSMAVGTLIIFKNYSGGDTVKAYTMVLTVLAVFQWFNAWNCRFENRSVFTSNPFANPFLIGATLIIIFLQALAVYNPMMQKILHTTALSVSEWLLIIAVASSVIIVEEIRKAWVRRYSLL